MIVLASLCGGRAWPADLRLCQRPEPGAIRARCSAAKGGGRALSISQGNNLLRVLAGLDTAVFEGVAQHVGRCEPGSARPVTDRLIAIDRQGPAGQHPKLSGRAQGPVGQRGESAERRCLGTELVEAKSNEIPAARSLLARLGPLEEKSRDARRVGIHNQQTCGSSPRSRRPISCCGERQSRKRFRKAAEQSMPARASPAPGPACQTRLPRSRNAANRGSLPPVPLALPPRRALPPPAEETNCGRLEQRSVRWVATTPKVSAASGALRCGEITREGDLPQRKVPRQAHLGDRALCEQPAMTPRTRWPCCS